ncbi:MAG TPA: hypothetical protein VGO47_00580, partial [Chlamydiales bacterium]|nr:hypothetical protein [Chlamydiales bacterium]
MTIDPTAEEPVTNGSASADTSVSVPDLHAPGPSSATSTNAHGSAIQSRHKRKKQMLSKHFTS